MGQTLKNRYQIIEKLGGGAFGQTYLAKDLDLPYQPNYVVKKLEPQNRRTENLHKAKELFDQEARVLYDIRHKQVPCLLAHFEEDYEFYLVQELIKGQTFEKYFLEKGKLNENQAINLLASTLKVLEYVHNKKIIHRDIKPSNLMRRKSGQVVLIDFGAVKAVSTQTLDSSTDTTVAIGTKGYICGEQARGKPKFSSDIYSLGIVAIEALLGGMPKDDSYTGEISWKGDVDIGSDFGDFLDRMIDCNYLQRFQTASDARQALKTLQNERREASQAVACTQTEEQALEEPEVASKAKKWFGLF